MAVAQSGTLVFFDDARARSFQPFALSRPQCEMRVGALLLRERWEFALATTSSAFASAPHLSHFEEFKAPRSATGVIPRGSIIVNARAVIALAQVEPSVNAWRLDDRYAAIRLQHDLRADELASGEKSLDEIASAQGITSSSEVGGAWLEEVWDSIRHLSALLLSDVPVLASQLGCTALNPSDDVRAPVIIGTHPVLVERGAVIEPFTVFDTALGPVLLRAGSHVQAFTRVIGPCYVGLNSSVVADRISGSAIGDTCRVHGELSASIFIGHSNKGHDGFVGHSILGRWVNLGAGTTTSNLKNTYGTVALWTPEGVRDTGLQFLGTMFGDHVKTGIGLRLTTGCVLGTGANVVDTMPPKVVAPFSWGQGAPYMLFDDTKFLETAERMMQRRQVSLSDDARQHLQSVFRARWKTA